MRLEFKLIQMKYPNETSVLCSYERAQSICEIYMQKDILL